MSKSAMASCSTAVVLFRGLYVRVASDLGIDQSYVSRVANGKRKSKIAEAAIAREFQRVMVLIGKSSTRPGKDRKKVGPKAIKAL
jgi:hypothetical protein